jgi:hypothetical protein
MHVKSLAPQPTSGTVEGKLRIVGDVAEVE